MNNNEDVVVVVVRCVMDGDCYLVNGISGFYFSKFCLEIYIL